MKSCYKAMVRIRTAGEPPVEEKIYEILADNPAEAAAAKLSRPRSALLAKAFPSYSNRAHGIRFSLRQQIPGSF